MNFYFFIFFVICFPIHSHAIEYIIKSNKKLEKFDKKLGELRGLDVSFGNYYLVRMKDGLDHKQLREIEKLDYIEFIEPNVILETQDLYSNEDTLSQKDWYIDQQWGILNNGRNSSSMRERGKAGEDINAFSAWEITKGKKEVIVAVIDTGVDYLHPDLKENAWVNTVEKEGITGKDDDENGLVDDIYGYNFYSDTPDPMDKKGHGTHCAGIIGAAHNELGIKGVMDNVRLMSLRFMGADGRGTVAAAVKSMNYAIENGAHILSNSWATSTYSQTLFDGVEATKKAGVVFVAAAGNEQNDNDAYQTYPADFNLDNVISVGAFGGSGKKAYFSNYGKNSVDVFAPGVSILSTHNYKSYKRLSGTSMAAPFVAGVLGLALSIDQNISYSELKSLLIESAVDNGYLDPYSVGGRADAYNLLKSL